LNKATYTVTGGVLGVKVVKSVPGKADEVYYFSTESDFTEWTGGRWLFK
jgi:hypothetical protein